MYKIEYRIKQKDGKNYWLAYRDGKCVAISNSKTKLEDILDHLDNQESVA